MVLGKQSLIWFYVGKLLKRVGKLSKRVGKLSISHLTFVWKFIDLAIK